jgi:cellulose synthase/poly-beta-1,6-N-acetylglucosamine synthase-like glycosyltransferase
VSHPEASQYENLFVRNQWAPQRYSGFLNLSEYADGLLGRNCAIRRSVVEEAWKTEEAVPTGTDYFLALRVIKAGQRILNVPQSNVETIFPETFSHYVKQQSRWLRNLLVLGHRYHDRRHAYHALFTSFLSTSLLAMPIMPLLIGNLGFVTWIVSWAAVVFNRVRYMEMLNCINEERKPIISIELFKVLFGDWFGWAKVLVDLLNPERRKKW